MQINFQAGVEDIYDACIAKGSTPSSTSLSDVVQGIMTIPTGITPSGTLSITSNNTYDVTNYASANVQVPASAVVSGTKSITANGNNQDVTSYKYANVSVPQYTWKVVNEGSRQISLRVYRNGSAVSFFAWESGASCTMSTNGSVSHT